jgi:hypothetical protein
LRLIWLLMFATGDPSGGWNDGEIFEIEGGWETRGTTAALSRTRR